MIILNASLPPASKDGLYALRSPYDGSLVRIEKEELLALIKKLQPDLVIFPRGLAGQIGVDWHPPSKMMYVLPR